MLPGLIGETRYRESSAPELRRPHAAVLRNSRKDVKTLGFLASVLPPAPVSDGVCWFVLRQLSLAAAAVIRTMEDQSQTHWHHDSLLSGAAPKPLASSWTIPNTTVALRRRGFPVEDSMH